MSRLANQYAVIFILLSILMSLPVVADNTLSAKEKLLQRSNEINRLALEIEQEQKRYANREKHKYITGSVTKTRVDYGTYLQQWKDKVERIGALKFRSILSQIENIVSVTVDVSLIPDGTVRGIRIIESSGYQHIDNNVITVVKMAAPFHPFPDSIRKEADVLHIVRKFNFVPKTIDE